MLPSARSRPLTFVLLLFSTLPIHLSAALSEGLESVVGGDGLVGDVCPARSDGREHCPVNCFRPNPVCGENGMTYWCGCLEAACAGVRVAKTGFCEVGNGGSGLVSGQALLLIHLVWLIVLGFSVLCGFL
ncbi:hypothetical protein AXF42_Ash018619 [Apostasia shenzhenica]|uniref:Kazal-like domain-containing protein n=1 Tax=Apostasia shenzhenica TaxID=1088818 RepID=A0A2I0B1G8_9ASPA|nr:hypothetical protein AXF42_Ash018619 [Apostasia shenzhenica]